MIHVAAAQVRLATAASARRRRSKRASEGMGRQGSVWGPRDCLLKRACGHSTDQHPCLFTGSTRSESYFKGVKPPKTQATPWEIRPEGCQFARWPHALSPHALGQCIYIYIYIYV